MECNKTDINSAGNDQDLIKDLINSIVSQVCCLENNKVSEPQAGKIQELMGENNIQAAPEMEETQLEPQMCMKCQKEACLICHSCSSADISVILCLKCYIGYHDFEALKHKASVFSPDALVRFVGDEMESTVLPGSERDFDALIESKVFKNSYLALVSDFKTVAAKFQSRAQSLIDSLDKVTKSHCNELRAVWREQESRLVSKRSLHRLAASKVNSYRERLASIISGVQDENGDANDNFSDILDLLAQAYRSKPKLDRAGPNELPILSAQEPLLLLQQAAPSNLAELLAQLSSACDAVELAFSTPCLLHPVSSVSLMSRGSALLADLPVDSLAPGSVRTYRLLNSRLSGYGLFTAALDCQQRSTLLRHMATDVSLRLASGEFSPPQPALTPSVGAPVLARHLGFWRRGRLAYQNDSGYPSARRDNSVTYWGVQFIDMAFIERVASSDIIVLDSSPDAYGRFSDIPPLAIFATLAEEPIEKSLFDDPAWLERYLESRAPADGQISAHNAGASISNSDEIDDVARGRAVRIRILRQAESRNKLVHVVHLWPCGIDETDSSQTNACAVEFSSELENQKVRQSVATRARTRDIRLGVDPNISCASFLFNGADEGKLPQEDFRSRLLEKRQQQYEQQHEQQHEQQQEQQHEQQQEQQHEQQHEQQQEQQHEQQQEQQHEQQQEQQHEQQHEQQRELEQQQHHHQVPLQQRETNGISRYIIERHIPASRQHHPTSTDRHCFQCGDPGHIRSHCPLRDRILGPRHCPVRPDENDDDSAARSKRSGRKGGGGNGGGGAKGPRYGSHVRRK